MSCYFSNDNNINILLVDDTKSSMLAIRDNHEVLFRKINTFLINKNIIKNNIIDSGAWIGDNSIPWAKNINGIVYAIDPSAENCSFITKTCELNQIKNVKVIQAALNDKNELLSTNDDINHCSFVYGGCGLLGINKINSVSLDYLYEQNQIENIGYIHLDVEGMEFKVLQGSNNLIDNDRPIVTYEQHLELDNYIGLLDYLHNKNYKCFIINEILIGCRPDCRNFIAFPNEKYNEQIITDLYSSVGQDILLPQ